MRERLLFLVAGLSLGFAPAPFPKPDPTKEDLKDLQGAWVRVKLTIDGRPSSDGPNGCPITIKGNHLQFPSPDDAWTITLDATRKPRTIVYKAASKALAGHVYRGVYRLEQDRLTLCVRHGGEEKDRPNDFDANKPGLWLQVFERKKP
jgi:uncharacterized protein (TIGR03067 family)